MQSKKNSVTNYCVCCGGNLPLYFRKETQHGHCPNCGRDFQYHLTEDGLACFVVDRDFMIEFGLSAFVGG